MIYLNSNAVQGLQLEEAYSHRLPQGLPQEASNLETHLPHSLHLVHPALLAVVDSHYLLLLQQLLKQLLRPAYLEVHCFMIGGWTDSYSPLETCASSSALGILK